MSSSAWCIYVRHGKPWGRHHPMLGRKPFFFNAGFIVFYAGTSWLSLVVQPRRLRRLREINVHNYVVQSCDGKDVGFFDENIPAYRHMLPRTPYLDCLKALPWYVSKLLIHTCSRIAMMQVYSHFGGRLNPTTEPPILETSCHSTHVPHYIRHQARDPRLER